MLRADLFDESEDWGAVQSAGAGRNTANDYLVFYWRPPMSFDFRTEVVTERGDGEAFKEHHRGGILWGNGGK